MKLSVKYLESKGACSPSINWFAENFGYGVYTIKQAFKFMKSKNIVPDYADVRWLIENCKFCQTVEMLEYYKSLSPDYVDVRLLIENCEFCQTTEMLEYYKSLNPSYNAVSWLIKQCKFAKENKNILK